MAMKKMTDAQRVARVKIALKNLVSDICTNKPSPELLGIAQNQIALCLAIIESNVDNEMVIGKNWADIENRILTDRAVARGVKLGEMQQLPLANGDDEPKRKGGKNV